MPRPPLSSDGDSRTPALYRLFLRFLPTDLRNEFGEEMAFVFVQRLREGRGLFQWARVWVRGCSDLLSHGLAERFNNTHRTKDRSPMFWDELRQDILFSFRTLGRSPIYTGVVVATLGVGIALNTIVFSVMNPFLLRPLPYSQVRSLPWRRYVRPPGSSDSWSSSWPRKSPGPVGGA